MRIFKIDGTQVSEHDALAPMAAPGACERGYLWLSLTREEFQASLEERWLEERRVPRHRRMAIGEALNWERSHPGRN